MVLNFERMGFLSDPLVSELLEMVDKVGRKLTGLIRHLGS